MAPEGDSDTYSPCWMLNDKYQGKGYMYEAAKAYYNYLFNEKETRRIYIYTEDYNLSCQKLSEKLGMRKEGLFKEFVTFVNDENGLMVDVNNLEQLTEAMEDMYKNIDKFDRKSISKKTVELFSPEAVANKIISQYIEVLNK